VSAAPSSDPAKGKGSSAKTRNPMSRPGGAASLVGTIVGGRYRLLRVIGEGGMGAVYEGEHVHMRKRSAVKVLHPDMSRVPEVVARFEREAMAASHIDHPNVAAATDFGKLDDGSFFLVLELVEGSSLRDVVAQGRLDASRALHIARQIAGALARAHEQQIVHRDLKPENVILGKRDGDPDFVKVLDFGIAKVPVAAISGTTTEAPALTQVGMVYGTPEYMAPEQAMGRPIDGRADLYALGIILFEMLAAERPFKADDGVVLLGMQVSAPLPRLADKAPVSEAIEAIVRKLAAKDPAERYATARDVMDAIDAVAGQPDRVSLPRAATVLSGPVVPKQSRLPAIAKVRSRVEPILARLRSRAEPILARAENVLPLDKLPVRVPKRQKLWIVIAAAAVLLVIASIVFFAIVHRLFSSHPASPLLGPAPIDSASGPGIDHRAKCLEASKEGDRATSLKEAAAWADANPAAAEADFEVAKAVRTAALDPATEKTAFELLETKLGSAGADALYDLAYGPAASQHAKRSLADPAVRKHMSKALAITMSIRDSAANPCDAKKYFAEAAKVGDQRTLDAITPWLKKTGCGRRGRHDCHACLRTGDDSVEKTADAIRSRVSSNSFAP
jgi:serine/threonine-protein kinase